MFFRAPQNKSSMISAREKCSIAAECLKKMIVADMD
jgi:hypothetical protein